MTEIQNDIDKNKLMILALAAKVTEIPVATETKDTHVSTGSKNVPKVTQESESENSEALVSDLSASLACCEVKESKETPPFPQSLSF
jgi:hypothetical protein